MAGRATFVGGIHPIGRLSDPLAVGRSIRLPCSSTGGYLPVLGPELMLLLFTIHYCRCHHILEP